MDLASLLADVAELPPSDAAQAYAHAGLRIFPCAPGGKRPITAHGFHNATTDPETINAWWTTTPAANIGIATGTTTGRADGKVDGGVGVDVLDIDNHASGNGYAGFEYARRAGLVDAWAALVRTPSGGAHAYYPAHPENPQRCWALAATQVDFRGIGGYVLAPPSTLTVDGREVAYRIISRGTRPGGIDADRVRSLLAPSPRAMSSNTRDARPVARRRTAGRVDLDRLAGWLSARSEGGRNAGLYWAACRCAEAGINHHTAAQALGDAASRTGLDTAEIDATIRSAYRTPAPSPATGPTQAQTRQERGLSL